MTKLERVRELLQKALMSFEHIATDKAVLEYDGDGELEVGMSVHGIDEEGNPFDLEDGEYRTEENIVYIIKEGKVEEIRDENEQAEPEAPAEEPVAEEPQEAEENEPEAEPEAEPEDDRIANLEAEIARLEAENGALREENDQLRARIDELENKPAAEPAEEQFEKNAETKKTGNKGIDNLVRRFSAQ